MELNGRDRMKRIYAIKAGETALARGGKTWSQADVDALEQHVRGKMQRKEKLTAGEHVLWGKMRNNQPISIRFVEDVDFMMGFDD